MSIRHSLVAALSLAVALPATAQDANVEGRVKKLEKEMQAVQRKVFPDGAGKFFEPEIKPVDTMKSPSGTSGAEVIDLTARVDSLESQLASLTGQIETQGNSVKLMEGRLRALEAQVKDLAAKATAATAEDVALVEKPAEQPAAATKPATKPAVAPASAGNARAKAVAAIERPKTADAFDDAYNYGYRLWEAKFYPEAQAQLEATVQKYPKNARISYAKNLLGRAWLDDGNPAQAAKIFYENYKTDPKGDRAPESLYFLGVALTDYDKPVDACGVFEQLKTAYPDEAKGRLATRIAEGRKRAKCK